MSNNSNPFTLEERPHNVRTDRHTANLFNITSSNRLLVGYESKSFQKRTSISLGFFFPQAVYPFAVLVTNLEPESAGNLF